MGGFNSTCGACNCNREEESNNQLETGNRVRYVYENKNSNDYGNAETKDIFLPAKKGNMEERPKEEDERHRDTNGFYVEDTDNRKDDVILSGKEKFKEKLFNYEKLNFIIFQKKVKL